MPLYGHLPGFLLRGFLDFIIIIIPIILFLAYSKFSSFWIKDLSSLLPKSEAQLFPSFFASQIFSLIITGPGKAFQGFWLFIPTIFLRKRLYFCLSLKAKILIGCQFTGTFS